MNDVNDVNDVSPPVRAYAVSEEVAAMAVAAPADEAAQPTRVRP